MKRQTMDLMQIHNLTGWKTQLGQLRKWKEGGKIRYIGITHYTDSSHEELEKIIKAEKPDFVQFNYSILSRHAEKRLLATAMDFQTAVIINRPFGEGDHFHKIRGKSLPGWAGESGITNWSAYFLKYIISHEAVTCVIPTTGNSSHAADNFQAGTGPLPDFAEKKKMIEYISSL